MFQKAKIFNNGHSQAVRLPKEFRFESKEVIIRKVANGVLLMPQDKNMFQKAKIFNNGNSQAVRFRHRRN